VSACFRTPEPEKYPQITHGAFHCISICRELLKKLGAASSRSDVELPDFFLLDLNMYHRRLRINMFIMDNVRAPRENIVTIDQYLDLCFVTSMFLGCVMNICVCSKCCLPCEMVSATGVFVCKVWPLITET
jgi:hypothetical protein